MHSYGSTPPPPASPPPPPVDWSKRNTKGVKVGNLYNLYHVTCIILPLNDVKCAKKAILIHKIPKISLPWERGTHPRFGPTVEKSWLRQWIQTPRFGRFFLSRLLGKSICRRRKKSINLIYFISASRMLCVTFHGPVS